MMGLQSRSNTVNRGLQTRSGNLNSGTLTTRETSGYSDLQEQAQVEWLESGLTNRAASDPQNFGQVLELALGSRADRATINALVDSGVSGNLPLPNVQFVDAGVLGAGALGAYDPRNGGTVLLDRSLLNDSRALERIYLEEVGHHLDAQFGAGDAAGDEGAIFARSMLGESLTAAQLNELRKEVDQGTVLLGGQLVDVEFNFGSDTPGGSVSGIGGNESSTSGSDHGGGSYSDNDHDDNRPSPASEPTGGYDEVGIDVPAPAPAAGTDKPIENETDREPAATPSPTDAPHGYDEVGIDVPAPAENLPAADGDDEVAAGATIALPAAVATRPRFWGGVGRGLASMFSFLGIGTATTGAGLLGMFWSSPAGGLEERHSIAGSNATIQINTDTLQGTVYVNGFETTISVVATTVDANGNPTGFAPATPMDAENLSTLGVDISDPSGVIDTSPLNSEGVDEAGATESASGMEGVSSDIHSGLQGKHEPGHNNYDDTRSPINEDVDPQELLDGAHSGEHPVVGTSGRGDPVVDFGVPIGVDVNTGQETQFGTIHSGKNGAHIVPSTPR